MAKATIGLTTTRWEVVTRMAERWQTAFIVPEVKRLGYKQVGHDTPFAHNPAFRVVARQSQVLTGVGHGGRAEFTGDLFEPLLKKGGYPKWVVEGKMFMLLSCLTGAELGPDTIKKGAAGYHGYYEEYSFDSDPKYQARPESDPILRFFFLPWTEHVLDFIRGKTNWESWLREWNGYVKGVPETHDPQLRDLLCREANIMRCQGDPDARLVDGKIKYSEAAAKANTKGKKKEACVKPEKGKTKESEEAAWSEFKDLIREDRLEKAASMYQKFVNILPAERSRLVTCIPKAYLIPPAMPRAMIPLNIRLRTPFGKEFIKVVKGMPR